MRRVAVLAVVAAALAAYLLLFDRHRSGGQIGSAARLVARFDRDNVRRVKVIRAGAPAMSLERQPAGSDPAWRLEPGGQAADIAAVEDVLGEIDIAEAARTADLDPAAAGLAPPRVTVEIDQPSQVIALRLGRTDASGTGVFVSIASGPVQVAPRRLLELTDRDPSAFRDRRLFPFAAEALTSVAWHGGANGAARALRRTDGRWQNELGDFAASERVAEAVRQLLALRVERYLPAPGDEGGAAAPLVEVATSGARASVTVGSGRCPAPDTTFVVRSGAGGRDGACLDGAKLRALTPVLDAAWTGDRRLLAAAPDTVTSVELTGGGRRLVLARGPGGWRFTAPSVAYAADTRLVDDWLAALHGTEVARAPAAGGQEARRLTVEGRDQEVAAVGPQSPAYALLDPDPLRFRERAALDFAHFDVRDLRRTAGTRNAEIASPDGDDWRVVEPPGAAVDRANVPRVVSALGNLRAAAFVSAPPPGKPELKLVVAVQPPGEAAPARHALELWPARQLPKTNEAPGCLGRLDSETSFVIPPAACDELRLPILMRSPDGASP